MRTRRIDESVLRHSQPEPRLGRVAIASGIALAVCWLPVGYGTFVRHDGNLHRLLDFLTAGHPTAGWSKALRVMGLQWGPRPEWIFGSRGANRLGVLVLEPYWGLAFGLLVAGGGFVLAVRNRNRAIVALGVLVALALAATVVSASQIVGPVFPYLVRWTWVVGALLGVVAVLGLLANGSARALGVGASVAVSGLVALGISSTVAAADADVPYSDRQAGEQSLSGQVLRALPDRPGPVLIDGTRALFAVPGLSLQIERQGIPVMIAPWQAFVYGDRRSPRNARFRAILEVVEGPAARDARTWGRRIATYSRSNAAGRRVDDVAVFLVPSVCRDGHSATEPCTCRFPARFRGEREGPRCWHAQ